jgi:hypothetical protein
MGRSTSHKQKILTDYNNMKLNFDGEDEEKEGVETPKA